ncbi:hypothetical protein ACFOHM_14295 [Microbaculum marinum]|uniref:hypothetical protein n=1 Tax=Microbaculum marinum TaxID=1764581 RepID=UPI00361582DD
MSGVRGKTRVGWCPSVATPMAAHDGLLVRIKPTAAAIAAGAARALAAASARFGSGEIDLTSRANLQVRGLRPDTADAFAAAMHAAGLAAGDGAFEEIRNVTADPLGADDPDAAFDSHAIARAIEAMLEGDAALHGLPPKFGFLVDCGTTLPVPDGRADIVLRGVGERLTIGLGGGALAVDCTVEDAPALALDLARAFLALAGPSDAPPHRMRELVAQVGEQAVFAEAGIARGLLHAAQPPRWAPDQVRGVDPSCGARGATISEYVPGLTRDPGAARGAAARRASEDPERDAPLLSQRSALSQPPRWAPDQVRGVGLSGGKDSDTGTGYLPGSTRDPGTARGAVARRASEDPERGAPLLSQRSAQSQPPDWAPDQVRGVDLSCGKDSDTGTGYVPGSTRDPGAARGAAARRASEDPERDAPLLSQRSALSQPPDWAPDQVRGVDLSCGARGSTISEYVPGSTRDPGAAGAIAANSARDAQPDPMYAAPPADSPVGSLPFPDRKSGAVVAGVPRGRLRAETLEVLASLAGTYADGTLRMTPWRAVCLVPVASEDAAPLLAALDALNLITDPADPRRALRGHDFQPMDIRTHRKAKLP